MGVDLVLSASKKQRRQLSAAGQTQRRALGGEKQRQHERQHHAVRKVANEEAYQRRDDQTRDDAQQSTQQVRQRSARQPEVDPPPPAKQVRRAQVGKDQTFQGRQPDDRPARARVAPDHEITEQKTTDHSEHHPEPSGQQLGTLHGLPPQETESPASCMNAPDLMGEENAAETASARVRTSTTSRPEGRPALAPAGIKARVRP